MGEEVKMSAYEHNVGEDERILEWEEGLPDVADLTPLSQSLIPPELASAFSITPVPHRTAVDVNRASRDTLSTLRTGRAQSTINNGYNNECGNNNNNNTDNNNNINSFRSVREPMVIEADNDGSGSVSGSDPKKYRKVADCAEEADSAVRADNSDDPSARTVKRPRLVWTPQLHKRFVDVVAHLGIKNAVPKTIMQLMNVEGLTRENVASHLQKYRLYLKRMQGLSNEGPSSSDQLFASTPVPQSLHESGGSASGGVGGAAGGMNGLAGVPIPVPYGTPVMPVPMYGHMGMHQGGFHQQNGFEGNAYGMIQPRDWSGNKYGSVMYQHHVAPSDQ